MPEPWQEDERPREPIRVLSAARVLRWVESQWNPKMQEFSEVETERLKYPVSYRDLIIGREELSRFLSEAGRIESALAQFESAAVILERIKDHLIRRILQLDIHGDAREKLEMMLRQRRRKRRQMLERLTGKQFFYFWFCEARYAITGKPNLPLALGDLFEDGEEQVQDHIQAARRTLSGD